MKNLFTKAVSIILIILIATVFSVFSASGYDVYNYDYYASLEDVKLLQNENQVFLIGSEYKTVSIDAVYPKSYNITLSLDNNVSLYNLCSDTLVMVCYISTSRQVQIVLYDINTDTLTSFFISSDFDYLNSHFVYANGYVYIAQQNGNIRLFSQRGKMVNQINLGTSICSLMTDYDENIYALSHSGMYSISENSFSRISSIEFLYQGRFVGSNIFVDNIGNFYRIDSNKVSLISNSYSDSALPSGGDFGDYVITFEDNCVFAVNKADGKIKKNLYLDFNILQLYTIDDIILVLCLDSNSPIIYEIKFSQLKNIKSNNTNNEHNDNSGRQPIYSNKYNVDYDNMKITGISYSTTISEFKHNMIFSGYDVRFYRYQKDAPLKSGNVGTATIAQFYNDESTYEFELAVTGDLTGEGNVNSRDEDLMFDYLLDSVTFNGVFTDSSDIDNSGDTELKDLVLLMRLIKEQN